MSSFLKVDLSGDFVSLSLIYLSKQLRQIRKCWQTLTLVHKWVWKPSNIVRVFLSFSAYYLSLHYAKIFRLKKHVAKQFFFSFLGVSETQYKLALESHTHRRNEIALKWILLLQSKLDHPAWLPIARKRHSFVSNHKTCIISLIVFREQSSWTILHVFPEAIETTDMMLSMLKQTLKPLRQCLVVFEKNITSEKSLITSKFFKACFLMIATITIFRLPAHIILRSPAIIATIVELYWTRVYLCARRHNSRYDRSVKSGFRVNATIDELFWRWT